MADGSGIHSDASLAHIQRGDLREPKASVTPLIGEHDKEADAKANVAYFRKRRSATEHSYEDYAAYAADRVAEARDPYCDTERSTVSGPIGLRPNWDEPKILKQAKDPNVGFCTCGAPEKVAPGIGPYCTRTGVDMKCKATLEDARPKLVRDIPTFEDHQVFALNVKDIPPLMPRFETKDSGVREDFPTGSRRDSRQGKGRYDLLPANAMRRLAQVYERGAAKYGDRNWEKGQPLSRFLDSALRHTFQVLEGKTDEDHAGQAAWNLLAFIETAERIGRGDLPADLNDLGIGKVR